MGAVEFKMLAVCDEVDSRLYGNGAALRARSTPDLMLGCGDLPAYYLDYLVSKFDVPLYAIHGNHDAAPPLEGSAGFNGCGANWIGGRTVRAGGLLLAGFDGSLRYNAARTSPPQAEMHAAVRALVPRLLLNRVRYGRYLDVLITHAPPRGIHDRADTATPASTRSAGSSRRSSRATTCTATSTCTTAARRPSPGSARRTSSTSTRTAS